jgi:hypothetical protein
MMKHYKLFFTMLLFLIIPFIMYGQGATTSSMSGNVTDTKGQPLAGATIVATHVPSGTIYGAITDVAGNYSIQNMRVGGPYTLRVSFVGYTSASYSDIILKLGEIYVQNGQLAEMTTTLNEVVVTSGLSNSILSSEREGPMTNVSTRELNNLPSITRSITDFTKFTPQSQGNSFGGRD